MKIEIELPDEEIFEMAKRIAAKHIADTMIEREYGSGYAYRKIIKEIVREVIRSDIENLSDRAVKAAAKSIENRAVKKMMDKMMEVSDDA